MASRRTDEFLEPMASLGATTSASEIVALPSQDVSTPFVACGPLHYARIIMT